MNNKIFIKEELRINKKLERAKIIPDKLYKYISFEKSNQSINDKKIKCLIDEVLYFGNIRNQNDTDEYNNILYENEIANSVIVDQIKRKENRDAICCFTDKSNNKNLIKKYANNGCGIMCEFEVFNKSNFYKIQYDKEEYIIHEAGDNEKIKELNKNKLDMHYITKKLKWRKESEYRLILENTLLLKKSLIDYNTCGVKLKSITIYDNCPKEVKQIIIEIANKQKVKII